MIEIIGVSKRFRIWEDRSRDLKETTINFLRGKKRSFRDVWALRGIQLNIEEGETVAFIGQNGSGKSTLLKLLGGIYSPDEGKIVTLGRISTLLELGIGFHPDLTGEENIYLNGAMLGFDRKEMEQRFDEIVSFSEIGDFVYSPIRTYSSGMLMRLGFSIATCVDPDILLVDEILAVGDEAFQEKCFERMKSFKEARKTIVLVSHSMEMVQKFCERVILLHKGRVVCDDVPEKTIEAYHETLYGPEYFLIHPRGGETVTEEGTGTEAEEPVPEEEAIVEERPLEEVTEKPYDSMTTEEEAPPDPTAYQRHGTLEAEITDVRVKSADRGEGAESFASGETISISLSIRFHHDLENPNVGMAVLTHENGTMMTVYSTNTLRRNMSLGFMKENTGIEVEFVQRLSLPEGEYFLTVAVTDPRDSRPYDWHENLKSFHLQKPDDSWDGTVDLNSQIIIRQ